MTDNDPKPEKETIVTTAEYRGIFIHYTSHDRILVKLYTETYPVKDLRAAKELIDENFKLKVN